MAKESIWERIKKMFIIEQKPETKKYEPSTDEIKNEEKIRENIFEPSTNDKKNEESTNENTNEPNEKQDDINIITKIISGETVPKEEIIQALKSCEKYYFDEEKELEIITSIGDYQNDPDILKVFIEETSKYSRFDDEEHLQIRKARDEAQKKINNLLLEEVLNSEDNEYTNSINLNKLLYLIKNDQIPFGSKMETREIIAKIYNKANEDLYNDISVIEALQQVFDIKMNNSKNKQIKMIAKLLKQKINLYYNTEGSKEEKEIALKQIPLRKIVLENDGTLKEYTIKSKDETKPKEKIEELTLEQEQSSDEIELVDYAGMLKKQEDRIKSSNLSSDEKEELIENLFNDFETYVSENEKKYNN